MNGRLLKVRSPLDACVTAPASENCEEIFRRLKNPYYLGDEVGLTQTLGWTGAWTSKPSAYAVVAQSTEDIVAAVNFARQNRLRLVVKGGGHSYLGTSNAEDSLMIWTRRMNKIALHDDFVADGCAAEQSPQPAVTIGPGAIWGQAYDAVTTRGGRYVQGGGCMTVGVAGLIQGGGFGSFSKAYGMAAASLLEAEVVTADGAVRIANSCTNPDLFWALKGGGGGSLGVVTRLTLRTYPLPNYSGAVLATIQSSSEEAFRRLIGKTVEFYSEALFNPHWGEQISFRPNNILSISMVFQGFDQTQVEAVWHPFFDFITSVPQDFRITSGPQFLVAPSRHYWDPEYLKKIPGVVLTDDRPDAANGNVFWATNLQEAGQVLHGYQSAWIPAAFLQSGEQQKLVDALFAAARHWGVTLHFNKGLAGAPAEVIAAARDTAMNPAVLDACALAISGAAEQPAYPGIPGHEPDLSLARRHADAIERAMNEIRSLVPEAGSYLAEGDYFDRNWQQSFWGAHYQRLSAVKDKYDPEGLFFVHHGPGSERWSSDGFVRLS